MPWFCVPASTSKKRSKKSKRKGGRKEIERCQKFVAIVKDYVAATTDEVSVRRGQVVELVCTKGNWVYIRGNNSTTGYVPKDYTLEVDSTDGTLTNINLPDASETVSVTANSNIAGPAPATRSINVGTLQHSGSSVTSVEVHQVNNAAVTEYRDSGEGQAEPQAQTTPPGSSQAIYEVPRCPDGAASGTVKSDNNGPTAPALPPRASGLPSAAEIQQSLSSHRYSPHHPRYTPQRHRPGNLSLSSSMNLPCPYHHRLRYPYGPFPPTADGATARCTCHMSSTNPGTQSSFPTPSGRPAPYTPNSMNGLERPPSTPGCSPPVWTPPSASRRLFGSNSPLSQHRLMVRPQTATTPGVPQTPGSASLPSANPASPVISNYPSTPHVDGSRDIVESLPTMGNGIRISSSSNSSYGRRAVARPQRSRRYSSDLQVHSTISENVIDSSRSVVSGTPKQYPRRRSQPCLVTNSVLFPENSENCPPQQHRPTALPVKRSMSMQEPYSNHRPLGGRNSCPCTPQQLSQQQQEVRGHRQIQRAVSCMEAVRTGKDGPSNATPTKTPAGQAEVIPGTSKRTCPAGAPSAKRRSRSSSNRLDSVPSIDEEPITTTTPDDVFLPESRKKPVGIFRCTKTYMPKFKGEIMLQENEIVIVLDYGMAEWAWVMTASNSEGLVSKSVLVRYHPNGLGAATATSSETPVLDDNDSGRGTITKQKGDRFQSHAEGVTFGVDASTQTDPVMDAALHTTPCSASVGLSTGYSTSSAPTNENSPLSTSQRSEVSRVRRRRRKPGGMDADQHKEEENGSKDENIVLLQAAATAVAKHAELQSKGQSQVPSQEWFNTIDSLDERERIRPYIDSRPASRKPSSSQLLESSSATQVKPDAKTDKTEMMNENERGKRRELEINPREQSGAAAQRIHVDEMDREKQNGSEASGRNENERRKEVRESAVAPSNSAAVPEKAAAAAERSEPANDEVVRTREVVKPGTLHYHDRISGMGSVNFNNRTPALGDAGQRSSRQRSRQIGLSNVLTAVKDFSPAPNSKNCIPIKEGDVLHLQTHMHYPKGWMWVWHTSRRSFGYVPKSYVAYTYDTVRRGRPRINTVEDAV